MQTKKGLRIAGADSDLNDLKQSIAQLQTIDLSVEEQKVIIIYALIQAKEPVKQYSLAQRNWRFCPDFSKDVR